jgi:hypothetical protein
MWLVPSKEDMARLDGVAETFLRDVGLSPEGLRDLTEKQFLIKYALTFGEWIDGSIEDVDLDLDEKEVQWLTHEITHSGMGRALSTTLKSGEPLLYLSLRGREREKLFKDIVTDLEERLTPSDLAIFGQIARRKVIEWRNGAKAG